MNEAVIQAIIRLLVGGAIAAISWIIANVTILSGSIHDPAQSGLVITVLVAVLNFVAKYLGGATTPVAETHGVGGARSGVKRPNILSV